MAGSGSSAWRSGRTLRASGKAGEEREQAEAMEHAADGREASRTPAEGTTDGHKAGGAPASATGGEAGQREATGDDRKTDVEASDADGRETDVESSGDERLVCFLSKEEYREGTVAWGLYERQREELTKIVEDVENTYLAMKGKSNANGRGSVHDHDKRQRCGNFCTHHHGGW